jgi:putative ABC transport system substrate-binding protein
VWQKTSGIDYRSWPLILVRKRVAVIVANTNATPYAISATKSIPIVFVTGRDPIAVGFVPNLNHPGGNVTGVSFFRF